MSGTLEQKPKIVKELIIVPGYFKSGSTLMFTHVWPKLGFTLLPKRYAIEEVEEKFLYRQFVKLLKKFKLVSNTSKVSSGRRIDFDLTQTVKQPDEIVALIRMIFEVSQSNKVVAELGFLRPGLPDDVLKRLYAPFQQLRAEGVSIKFMLYVREQSELITSRAKHDMRSFPPYLEKPPSLTIDTATLEETLSEERVCRCIYPYCMSLAVDRSKNDCVGDCGFLGKKVYEWKFYDFTHQVKRIKQLTGIADVYVQPLNYLAMYPKSAIERLSNWLGVDIGTDLITLPKANGAPDNQNDIKMTKNAKNIVGKRYQETNKALCESYDLPIETMLMR